jgi:hypothetical protein
MAGFNGKERSPCRALLVPLARVLDNIGNDHKMTPQL